MLKLINQPTTINDEAYCGTPHTADARYTRQGA